MKRNTIITMMIVLYALVPKTMQGQSEHFFHLKAGYYFFQDAKEVLPFYENKHPYKGFGVQLGYINYWHVNHNLSWESNVGYHRSTWSMQRIRDSIVYNLHLSEYMIDVNSSLSYKPVDNFPLYGFLGLGFKIYHGGRYDYEIFENARSIYYDEHSLDNSYVYGYLYFLIGLSYRISHFRFDIFHYTNRTPFTGIGIGYEIPF